MFIEDTDNNITYEGKTIINRYSMTSDDFYRFTRQLRDASINHKVDMIQNTLGQVFDVEDFIIYEHGLLKKYLSDVLTDV